MFPRCPIKGKAAGDSSTAALSPAGRTATIETDVLLKLSNLVEAVQSKVRLFQQVAAGALAPGAAADSRAYNALLLVGFDA
jgi:hypothetical protein